MNASNPESLPSSESTVLARPNLLLRVLEELHWMLRVFLSAGDRFYWDNGFSRAASLAYTTLLSLVPAVALAFGILSSFAVSAEYVDQVRKLIFKQFVPNLSTVDTVIEYLTIYSQSISSMNALVISFLVLTSLLLLNSIEYALNEVWQVYEQRSIAHRIQIFSAIILIFPALALSGVYFVTLRVEPYFTNLPLDDSLRSMYNSTFPFLIDFLAFVSLYYLVPKAPVRLRSALFGAFVAALMFGFAKALFALYIERFSSYSRVYGTVAGVPIFLFWLYLAWAIVLIGAELCFQAQYLPRSGKLWKRSVMTIGDGRMVLGMQALVIIGRAFLDGKRLPSDLELAESLGCSSVVLKPTLDALEKAQIVTRGDTRDQPITLLRSPDKINVAEIREALFRSRTALHFPRQMARVFKALHVENGARQTSLSDVIEARE